MSTKAMTGQQIIDAGLDGWAFLVHYGLFRLHTRVHTKSFSAGLKLVHEIGQAAEEMNHHADLDLRPSRVDVRLTSGYEAHGVTELDVRLARRVSEIAAAAGAELESRSLSCIELALDTPDHEKIAPFWAAVLDRAYVSGDGWADVGDRNQVQPLIWFQHSGSEEPRQRWHLDVWVDPEQVQPRVDAALAAGGTLIRRDQGATLADPDGNKICLCTWQPTDGVVGG
jgi:4a-hydroxytetrahydrobiopterin dehydratase